MVTIAISASIVKSRSSIRPWSLPTVSNTISISPRVFIRMPTAADSRIAIPAARAPPNAPRNFPAQAAARIRRKSTKSPARSPGMSTAIPDVTK